MTLNLKVAMIQMDIANEPLTNAKKFLAAAWDAAAHGADIIVGSEMMLAPYFRGDSYEDDEFVRDMWTAAMYIVKHSEHLNAVLIFGGIGLDEDQTLVGEDGRLRKYNAAFVSHHGKLIHNRAKLPFAIKANMPDYRIFDDNRHFFSLRKVAEENALSTEALLQPFPVTICDTEYQLGVMLCEDMWDDDYSLKPAQELACNGADILINLSSSNWSWRKNAKRDRVIKAICEETSLPFVYVNNVGVQNNGKNFITFDGASTAYDGNGNIVAMCDRYKELEWLVDFSQSLPPLVRDEPEDVAQMFEAIEVASRGFIKTLPESVKDKVVIGVSGGMDSALSVAFFAHLLGPEKVLAINLPYKHFNSDETKEDARILCERLGVEYRITPIDRLVDAMCETSGATPGSPQHKTAQAIARMNVIAAVAGMERGWFPCNANWTEIFFGYGTLNGDLRGSFAPWMNCLKQDVYRLADYMNRVVYGREVIPQSIIDRAPMDELTAAGTGERKDPFDYGTVTKNGYHDQMVRAVVAFRRGPEWFLEQYLTGTLEEELKLPQGKIKTLFPDGQAFLEDLEQCFKRYFAAIPKRVQSVPGPLVDKRSFGWDFRESIGISYQTERLKALIEEFKGLGFPAFWSKDRRARLITSSTAGLTIISSKGGMYQEIA